MNFLKKLKKIIWQIKIGIFFFFHILLELLKAVNTRKKQDIIFKDTLQWWGFEPTTVKSVRLHHKL